MTAVDSSGIPRPKGAPPITPLRKRNADGPYVRPPEIEVRLVELSTLTPEQVSNSCKIRMGKDPEYVPSECVLNLVRACREDGRSIYFETLYKILTERVFQRLPKAERSGAQTLSLTDARIRETAFDKFVEMLVRDRTAYEEQLDYYEVRFNDAMSALLVDAQRKVLKETTKLAPLEVDPGSGVLSGEVERTGDSFDPFNPIKLRSEDYRSSLDAAIDSLTQDHRRIIEMIRLGIPIDSQEPDAITIAKTLKKSEKTVRTFRDQAYADLHAWLTKGESL